MLKLQELDAAYAEYWDLSEAAAAAVKNMRAASDPRVRKQLRSELSALDLKRLEVIDKIDAIYDEA
jgi:hypothetical protein